MSKKLVASLVVSAVLLSSPAIAEESASYSKCLADAHSAEAELDCIADEEERLIALMEQKLALFKDRCNLLSKADASSCKESVNKTHQAYIDYYDKMAVPLTYLATTKGQDDSARVKLHKALNELTKAHIQMLEATMELSK